MTDSACLRWSAPLVGWSSPFAVRSSHSLSLIGYKQSLRNVSSNVPKATCLKQRSNMFKTDSKRSKSNCQKEQNPTSYLLKWEGKKLWIDLMFMLRQLQVCIALASFPTPMPYAILCKSVAMCIRSKNLANEMHTRWDNDRYCAICCLHLPIFMPGNWLRWAVQKIGEKLQLKHQMPDLFEARASHSVWNLGR